MGWRAAAVASLVVAVTASRAYADEGSEARRADLYREGTELAQAGRWAEAAARFREVVAIRSAPRARIALAVAEENLGHLVAAEREYAAAVDEARSQSRSDDEATALAALRLVSQRIPRLRLDVPSDVAAPTFWLDGQRVSLRAGELEVDPGDHVLRVEAPGRAPFERRITATESERRELRVELPVAPASSAPAAGSKADASASKARVPVGALVLGGVGLAGVGVATALWGVGRGRERDLDEQCPGRVCDASARARLSPDIDSAHSTIVAGNVTLAVGLTVLAAGGVWLAVALAGGGPSAKAAAAGASSATALRF